MEAELSPEDQKFLNKCEEEFKDRFTEKDEEYMKVYNRNPSTPPIMENYWQPPNNYGRRNDHRNNRRYNSYDRHGHRNRQGGSNRGNRGYNDHNSSGYNSTSRY